MPTIVLGALVSAQWGIYHHFRILYLFCILFYFQILVHVDDIVLWCIAIKKETTMKSLLENREKIHTHTISEYNPISMGPTRTAHVYYACINFLSSSSTCFICFFFCLSNVHVVEFISLCRCVCCVGPLACRFLHQYIFFFFINVVFVWWFRNILQSATHTHMTIWCYLFLSAPNPQYTLHWLYCSQHLRFLCIFFSLRDGFLLSGSDLGFCVFFIFLHFFVILLLRLLHGLCFVHSVRNVFDSDLFFCLFLCVCLRKTLIASTQIHKPKSRKKRRANRFSYFMLLWVCEPYYKSCGRGHTRTRTLIHTLIKSLCNAAKRINASDTERNIFVCSIHIYKKKSSYQNKYGLGRDL